MRHFKQPKTTRLADEFQLKCNSTIAEKCSDYPAGIHTHAVQCMSHKAYKITPINMRSVFTEP